MTRKILYLHGKKGECSARKQRGQSLMHLSRTIERTLPVFWFKAARQMKVVRQQGGRTMQMEKTASLEAVTKASWSPGSCRHSGSSMLWVIMAGVLGPDEKQHRWLTSLRCHRLWTARMIHTLSPSVPSPFQVSARWPEEKHCHSLGWSNGCN